jgi:hypothetical protein
MDLSEEVSLFLYQYHVYIWICLGLSVLLYMLWISIGPRMMESFWKSKGRTASVELDEGMRIARLAQQDKLRRDIEKAAQEPRSKPKKINKSVVKPPQGGGSAFNHLSPSSGGGRYVPRSCRPSPGGG